MPYRSANGDLMWSFRRLSIQPWDVNTEVAKPSDSRRPNGHPSPHAKRLRAIVHVAATDCARMSLRTSSRARDGMKVHLRDEPMACRLRGGSRPRLAPTSVLPRAPLFLLRRPLAQRKEVLVEQACWLQLRSHCHRG